MSNAVLGMTMLGLIVVVIMLGFPTAFTLMGLGMFFGFIAFYNPAAHWLDNQVFDLMVQRAFGAMTNETLLSIPLFVLMGYVMERGALVDKMFHSVQLAFRRVPASLAVTTLIVCTFWLAARFSFRLGGINRQIEFFRFDLFAADDRAGSAVRCRSGPLVDTGRQCRFQHIGQRMQIVGCDPAEKFQFVGGPERVGIEYVDNILEAVGRDTVHRPNDVTGQLAVTERDKDPVTCNGLFSEQWRHTVVKGLVKRDRYGNFNYS